MADNQPPIDDRVLMMPVMVPEKLGATSKTFAMDPALMAPLNRRVQVKQIMLTVGLLPKVA